MDPFLYSAAISIAAIAITYRRTAMLLVIATAMLCGVGILHAQATIEVDEPAEQENDVLTGEMVARRREEASQSPDLDAEAKAQVDQLYQQARVALARATDFESQAAAFDKRAADAQARLEALKQEVAGPAPEQPFDPPANADVETLEAVLAEARQALGVAQEKFNAAEATPKRRALRQAELSGELAALPARLEKAEAALAKPLDPATAEPLALAERTLREAEYLELRREAAALRSEEAMLLATLRLPPLELDAAAARLAPLKESVDELQQRVRRSRAAEVADELKFARREAKLAPAPVKAVLEENVELIERGQDLAKRREALQQQLAADIALRDQWRKTIETTKANIAAVGLWETIAWEMRSQRRMLPRPRQYHDKPRQRREAVRELQYERLKLYDRDAELADIDNDVDALLAGVNWPVAESDEMEIRFAAREAYEDQSRLVDQLLPDYERYFQLVTQLDTVQLEIAAESADYAQFIDERVLWIRSTTPIFGESPALWRKSLAAWSNLPAWQALGQAALADVRRHPVTYILALVGFSLWFYAQRRLRERIGAIGRQVRSNPTVPLRRSFEAFFLTVIVSLLWPGLTYFFAWRFEALAGVAPLARAVADGLFLAALTYLFLEVPRRFCRGNGIAEAHFLWPSRAVAQLRNAMRLSIAVLVPLAWVIGVTESLSGRTRDDPVGRIIYVLAMLFTAAVAWMMFRPRGALVQAIATTAPEGWLARGRRFLFAPGVVLALTLATLAAVGLYHTALELSWRMALSLVLLFVLIVANGLGHRWFVAARVRLARARLLRNRQAAQATPRTGETNGGNASADQSLRGESDAPDATAEIDVATINLQTRRILLLMVTVAGALGLWWIWIDVFPALGALRRVAVANTSLANITLAVMAAVLAYVAARNLPGLLEVAVLQNLPLDGGARYAITTICRYSICIAAVIAVTSLIGFDWSSIQWLVAAMLVGLGFGLQEIFANFVSGLIILLERPIRVGDFVTVDKTDGRVLRINMRATTILDWDRKEMVVPNKEIITGKVINWTLTENTLRIVIHVGIAYGSDTQLATDILHRICAEHRRVLEKPRPKVIFREFGDSALIFELRIFIPDLDYWPRVMHEMHMAIDREFRAAGIVIAFPQRDVHVIPPGALPAKPTATDEADEH